MSTNETDKFKMPPPPPSTRRSRRKEEKKQKKEAQKGQLAETGGQCAMGGQGPKFEYK
jgi:hypothetical protein